MVTTLVSILKIGLVLKMSKYNIKYKANDGMKQDVDMMKTYENEILKVFDFYKKYLGEEPQFRFGQSDLKKSFTMTLTWKPSHYTRDTAINVYVNMTPNRNVYSTVRSKGSPINYRPLTKSELRFFDSYDFTLDAGYANDVNLEVTDWFGMEEEAWGDEDE